MLLAAEQIVLSEVFFSQLLQPMFLILSFVFAVFMAVFSKRYSTDKATTEINVLVQTATLNSLAKPNPAAIPNKDVPM